MFWKMILKGAVILAFLAIVAIFIDNPYLWDKKPGFLLIFFIVVLVALLLYLGTRLEKMKKKRRNGDRKEKEK